jgi:hypothetical protein
VTAALTCKLKLEQISGVSFKGQCFVCNEGPDDSKAFSLIFEGSAGASSKSSSGVPKNNGLPATNAGEVTGNLQVFNYVTCRIADVLAGGTQWPAGKEPGSCTASMFCSPVTVGPTVTWLCESPNPAFPAVPTCP